MDFWNWSLWALIPLALVLAVLVASCIRLTQNDPKLVAQRKRYRQEALDKGFYPRAWLANLMFCITIACWVVAGIVISRGEIGTGAILIIVPFALLVWETMNSRRLYRERRPR